MAFFSSEIEDGAALSAGGSGCSARSADSALITASAGAFALTSGMTAASGAETALGAASGAMRARLPVNSRAMTKAVEKNRPARAPNSVIGSVFGNTGWLGASAREMIRASGGAESATSRASAA